MLKDKVLSDIPENISSIRLREWKKRNFGLMINIKVALKFEGKEIIKGIFNKLKRFLEVLIGCYLLLVHLQLLLLQFILILSCFLKSILIIRQDNLKTK